MRRKWVMTLAGIGMSLPFALGQDTAPSSQAPPSQKQHVQARPIAKLTLVEREALVAAQRGAEWLQRVNRPDGRFLYGYVPALRSPMEGDSYLQQAGAALALARAARFYHDDKAAALARQAVLTLLLETKKDPKVAGLAYPAMPNALVNHVAAAGMLILSVHELPAPATDLLQRAAELTNYLRAQQRSDGSLLLNKNASAESQALSPYAGIGLEALVSGRPETWQTDAVRKACHFYSESWRRHKTPMVIAAQTAAYSRAYAASRDQALADVIFEMNDWLCGLQYQEVDPRRPLWRGGFKNWRDGQEIFDPPEITSAEYAESLVCACQAAKQAGDVRRWEKYREAADRCIQFLATLQYTDGNTQHFASWYRPALVGAFHQSHQDGNLQLDYTSRAVAALVLYLETFTTGG